MEALFATYDAAEFAVIADYLARATHILAEETARLRDK